MKNLIDNQVRNIDLSSFRTTSTFILATSFSMIIFLLSLISERNIILDLGIMFLFFSVVILFDLYISSIYYENQILSKKTESKKILKIERKIEGISFFGLIFFYLGLLFLIYYFNLFIVFIIFTVYLWYKSIADLKSRISVFRSIKKGYKEFKVMANKKMTILNQEKIQNTKEIELLNGMSENLKIGMNNERFYMILRIIFLISVISASLFLSSIILFNINITTMEL